MSESVLYLYSICTVFVLYLYLPVLVFVLYLYLPHKEANNCLTEQALQIPQGQRFCLLAV